VNIRSEAWVEDARKDVENEFEELRKVRIPRTDEDTPSVVVPAT
jgi:hypothetical protein